MDDTPVDPEPAEQDEANTDGLPDPVESSPPFARVCSEGELVAWVRRIVNQDEQALACLYDALAGRASEKNYSLILMDMQMPRLGGLEATQRIRLLPQYKQIPIVAMTANAFDEDMRRCMDAGMNDYIPKPVSPEQLYSVVLHWLDKSISN